MLSLINGEKDRSIFLLSSFSSLILFSFHIDRTHWIDVCQNNGNLLALAGTDQDVKIFDKRESEIVRIFDDVDGSNISLIY